jgi:hypothetical protein
MEIQESPALRSVCFCTDCMGTLDTLESIGVDALRTEDRGHMTSLVYSDSIRVTRGSDKLAAFYQRKPASLRMYSTCCQVYLGAYASGLKVAMLSSALFDDGDHSDCFKVNAGSLSQEQRDAIEGAHKTAPFGFILKFMGAALMPFNGHKKVQWIPDSVLEAPSSQELIRQSGSSPTSPTRG